MLLFIKFHHTKICVNLLYLTTDFLLYKTIEIYHSTEFSMDDIILYVDLNLGGFKS